MKPTNVDADGLLNRGVALSVERQLKSDGQSQQQQQQQQQLQSQSQSPTEQRPVPRMRRLLRQCGYDDLGSKEAENLVNNNSLGDATNRRQPTPKAAYCNGTLAFGSVILASRSRSVDESLRRKLAPAKLMRTSSASRRKQRSFDQSAGDRRLDEELEELDEHLMSTTLKNIKFMHGSKFTMLSGVAFQRECLDAHNKIRQLYGCPGLSWCQELAAEAELWAQTVAERGRILYRELPGIGENISLLSANGSDHLPTGAEATELWANEAQHYDYNRPTWSPKYQHFAQLVWKRTTELGVSRVWSPSKSLVAIVAFYKPAGNCNGLNEFRENIPRPVHERQFLPSSLTSK